MPRKSARLSDKRTRQKLGENEPCNFLQFIQNLLFDYPQQAQLFQLSGLSRFCRVLLCFAERFVFVCKHKFAMLPKICHPRQPSPTKPQHGPLRRNQF